MICSGRLVRRTSGVVGVHLLQDHKTQLKVMCVYTADAEFVRPT